MAMTKKERAELERVEHELALHRALRFPTYADSESFGSEHFGGVPPELAVTRYTINIHTGRVSKHLICREGVRHFSEERNTWFPEQRWEHPDSRRGMRFYDEEALALEHLRMVKTREFAEELLVIDARIAATQEG